MKKSFILISSVLGRGNGNSVKVHTGGWRGSQLPAVASCMTVYLPAETTHAASFTGRKRGGEDIQVNILILYLYCLAKKILWGI